MSQSDFIKYKKTLTTLKNQSENLSPILSQNDYDSFIQYSLENTIQTNKISFHQLLPQNKQLVFNMEKTVSSCPTFLTCSNTNQRPNRVLNNVSDIPYILNPGKFVKNPPVKKCECVKNKVCICSKRICKCKTQVCNSCSTSFA